MYTLIQIYSKEHNSENIYLRVVQVDETKKLGSGTFGTVFAGTYEGNPVAVKKIPLDKVDNEINLQREMELHKQLDHQHVLKLLHIDEEKDPKCK